MYRLIPFFVLLVFSGCLSEPRPAGFPKLVPCALLITQEGQPLADASVSLFPVESGNKWSSGGMSDANGLVRLRTHGKFDGVPVGKYKVVIQKQITEGKTDSAPMHASPQEIAEFERRRKANPPRTYNLVETVFTSPQTTTLEINVEKKSKNPLTLDAGKAVRAEVKVLP